MIILAHQQILKNKGGFEDEDTAENIGCSLCFSVVPSGGSAGVPI